MSAYFLPKYGKLNVTKSNSPFANFCINSDVEPVVIYTSISGYFFIKSNTGLTINELINELFPPILTFPFSNVIYFENIFSALFIVSILFFTYS